MKNMILTLNLEVIIPEVEKTLDDFFNELFIRNYIWLIILVVITLILLLFFILKAILQNQKKLMNILRL